MVCKRVLFCGISVIALGSVLLPALGADDDSIETVVVTSRRAALQTALEIKENAAQIVDAVVADDAGKLPDNSITEVLQRVSGVTITHFNSASDPDHYSVEGSGVAIRGMTQISSTLNGRASFSANGGRALLWEDVTPELMSAVNVYKSATADQIEGGVGGSVDLRTHMPFDFDGLTVRATGGASYGDFIDQVRPSGSIMASDRWNTKIGEIGFLVDMAYSDISSRSDTIQVDPYFPHVNTYNSDWSTNSDMVWIPGGVSFRTQTYDRKRAGLYEAIQWRPTENLTIYQTAFVSYYKSDGAAYEFMDSAGAGMSIVYSTTDWTIADTEYDAKGNLLYASRLISTDYNNNYWTPLSCSDGNMCSIANAATRADRSNLRTTDLTEGFDWQVNDAWQVEGAFQYVHSTSNSESNTLYATVALPDFGLDLRGKYPVATVSDPDELKDAANYNWAATMLNKSRNSGTSIAANLDFTYRPNDSVFWKSVQFGMRGAIRKENDRDTGYDYKELSAWYEYGDMHYLDENTADADYVSFDNYFRGAAHLPSTSWFPSLKLAQTYSDVYAHENYSWSSDDGYTPRTLDKYSLSYGETKTAAAYVRGNFGLEDFILGMPMDGNIGLRVVYNHNYSSGYLREYEGTSFYLVSDGTEYTTYDSHEFRDGGRDFWVALPSLNLNIMPTSSTHIRLALSESMGNMDFNYLRAGGTLSFVTVNSVIKGYQVSTGQPDLKPQISRNLDLAFEWYGDGGDEGHISGFWKSIKDYITYGLSTGTYPFNLGDYGTEDETAQVLNYFNAKKETMIRGVEIGGTKFASFLPSPFDGIGVQANATYIDSRAPGDVAYDMFGNLITGLPVDLLSRYNYNVTAMYEKAPFSFRLAWSWRSKYLLSPASISSNYADTYIDTAANVSGTATSGNYCTANNYSVGGTGANPTDGQCYYSLPVFSKAFGQLDAGIQYDLNEMFSFSLSAQNLLNAETRTTMGYGSQKHNRSWFVSDRRIALSVSFKY